MFVPAIAVFAIGSLNPEIWRNYDEIFDLTRIGNDVFAATNGGLLRYSGDQVTAIPSPSGLRGFASVDPLVVRRSNGSLFNVSSGIEMPIVQNPGRNFQGRQRDINLGTQLQPEEGWLVAQPELRAKYPFPPPGHIYAEINFRGQFLVGSSLGLYLARDGKWDQLSLASNLPVKRPNGIAKSGSSYVVGGMDGLAVGKPGHWEMVDSDPVRHLYQFGEDVWVVRGSGAVDKMCLSENRFYPDVLTELSLRPWTSCLATGPTLLFGGQGGWTEQSNTARDCYPEQLGSDVVTAIIADGPSRWIGTQKSGLWKFSFSGARCWNPGNGLTDPWVTALKLADSHLIVGTSSAGLFQENHGRLNRMDSPTRRVTCLYEWGHDLVVGGMDGAWIRNGGTWKPLDTMGEETTAITSIDGRLTVVTNCGVFFL